MNLKLKSKRYITNKHGCNEKGSNIVVFGFKKSLTFEGLAIPNVDCIECF